MDSAFHDGVFLEPTAPEFNYHRYQRVHVRWLIRRDMPEVLAAEWASRGLPVPPEPRWTPKGLVRPEHKEATATGIKPWLEEDFLRCLRERNCIGMVAECRVGATEQVVGFMVYVLHKFKLHILNFVVHPDHQRKHIASQMLGKLTAKLSSHRRRRITLEVRESSLAAQLFFRSQGFQATGVLRGWYEDSREDAYMLEYNLPGHEEERQRAVDLEAAVRNRLNSL